MARPTNQQRGLSAIVELSDEATEQIDSLLNWLDTQSQLAVNKFDKPQQARVGEASRTVARLSQTLYHIRRRANEAQTGDYSEE